MQSGLVPALVPLGSAWFHNLMRVGLPSRTAWFQPWYNLAMRSWFDDFWQNFRRRAPRTNDLGRNGAPEVLRILQGAHPGGGA